MSPVGRRVECEGVRGTVQWQGEVAGTQGEWWGVDWDDGARGKHDGTHNGIQYFTTRESKSGSFVRPAKVNTGITVETAVRDRYQDDPTVESEVMEQLQKKINARFVEVVGMDKVGARQSKLEELETAVLSGLAVWGTDRADLAVLLPRLHSLDLSYSLLSSWHDVAQITRQLPSLRFLNISGNMLSLPDQPEELQEAVGHVTHLVLNNMLGYTWSHLLLCCSMFSHLTKLQVAFNKLEVLGPVPEGLLNNLEDLDLGVNPLTSWEQVCHVGLLPRLECLNVNRCQLQDISFPSTPPTTKTNLFSSLKSLAVADNPLDIWNSVAELNKLQHLEELVLTVDNDSSSFHHEFIFSRIHNLKMLNRSRLNALEKKDCELFYLKTFSDEYYNSGGQEVVGESTLTQEFIRRHPTYAQLAEVYGAPTDETREINQRHMKLKDQKLEVEVVTPDDPSRRSFHKTFLPSIRVSKVKMMLKRHLKLGPATQLRLSYSPSNNEEKKYEIPIDSDMKELSFYSMNSGDTLLVRW